MLAALLAAGFLGVGLLVVALRGRREGAIPFCRRCGYDLSGHALDEGPKCPECGSGLADPRAVVVGTRRVRPRLAFAGAALMLLTLTAGITLGVARARQFDWYTLRPTAWVIDDLKSGVASTRALIELRRRATNGSLNGDELIRANDAALDRQAAGSNDYLEIQALMEWLVDRYGSDTLSAEQRRRFLEQMIAARIYLRSRAMVGDTVPLNLHANWRGPGIGADVTFDCKLANAALECDGVPLQYWSGGQNSSELGASHRSRVGGTSHTLTNSLLSQKPGLHEVVWRLSYEVFEVPPQGKGDPSLVAAGELVRSAKLTVLTERPSELVSLRYSAELDAAIARSVLLTATPRSEGPQAGPNYWVYVDSTCPIGVVLAIQGPEARSPFGVSNSAIVGGNGLFGHGAVNFEPAPVPNSSDPPATTRLILLTIPKAAEVESPFDEVWDGELVFENVPLAPTRYTSIAPTVRRRTMPERE
jgi:hypothetical protein